MIILQETASAQTIKVVARELYEGVGYVHITDEMLNTTTEHNSVNFLSDRFYTTCSVAMSELKNDRHFVIKMGYGGTEIYKGKIFVTSQTNYSINNTL